MLDVFSLESLSIKNNRKPVRCETERRGKTVSRQKDENIWKLFFLRKKTRGGWM